MNKLILALFFLSLNLFNCQAERTGNEIGKSIVVGTVNNQGHANLNLNLSVLSTALTEDFDVTTTSELTIVSLNEEYYLSGLCNEKGGALFTFWIRLYSDSGDLELRESSYVHTCTGNKCSSCKLTINSAQEGGCFCKLHALAEEDGYCEHSVSSGTAVSSGLINKIQKGLDKE